jgi:hypothetical protein
MPYDGWSDSRRTSRGCSRPQRRVPFPIDREGPVPTFYVLTARQEANLLGKPGELVFAPSGEHFARDWLMLGIVSAQSPFGQGTGAGVKKSDVREAMWVEVRHAVQVDHPVGGPQYVPNNLQPNQADLRSWDKITHRQIAAVMRSMG